MTEEKAMAALNAVLDGVHYIESSKLPNVGYVGLVYTGGKTADVIGPFAKKAELTVAVTEHLKLRIVKAVVG
jgi:hypothetical protein